MPKTSQAQMKAQYKYAKTHLKRIPLDLHLDLYERLKAAADDRGESVNGFIKKAIQERLEKL